MKKVMILTTATISSLMLPSIVLSCSNNSENINEQIVNDEINRIEKIKINFKLKAAKITLDFIKSLNENNLLENIDGWEKGEIPNQNHQVFNYQIIDFNNGLNQLNNDKKLTFKIEVAYQEIKKTTSLITINYQLENDLQPPQIPSDQLLNPSGGKIGNTNLNASAYSNLITSLNLLTEDTYLPNITNELLEQKLQENPDLKNISLMIANGSNTQTGTLNLTLTNLAKNQVISIEITGFKINQANSQEQLQYHNFQINQKLWFDQKLPIDTTNDVAQKIQAITSEKWNQLLDDFQILSTKNLFAKASELKQQGFSFDIQATYNNKKINFKITTKFIHKSFSNNKWNDGTEISWDQASHKTSSTNIFDKKILSQFIIDQTQLNEQELIKHLPSYYLAKNYFYKAINNQFNRDDDLFINAYLKNKDFMDVYFDSNKQIQISFILDSINANDWDNHLSFSIGITEDDQFLSGLKNFNLSKQNKPVEQVLENKLNENSVQILNDSRLKTIVVNHLKKNHKNEVDQLFNVTNETKIFKDFNQNQIQEIIRKPLLNYDDKTNTDNRWIQLEKLIQPSIFRSVMSLNSQASFTFNKADELNLYSHLYWFNSEEAIVIEQIQYEFENQVEIKLIKSEADFIKAELSAKTVINFAGGIEKTIPTTFYFNIFKNTDWP